MSERTTSEPMKAQHPSIERLRDLWQSETDPSGRRAAYGVLGLGVVLGLYAARVGHDWARAGAGALVVLGVCPAIARAMVARRRRIDPRAIMAATVLQTEPEIGRSALRALDLAERTERRPDTGSPELASLHLARVLGRAALDPVASRADRRAWTWTAVALATSITALALVVVDPFRLVEGGGVAAATGDVAPIRLEWVEDPEASVEPPSYLDMPKAPLRPYFPAALHVGSVVTYRATALHPGRRLVLGDRRRQVDFVEDGHGALVARWTVLEDASLRVSARFGSVLIEQPRSLEIHALEDVAPHVRLEGAPRTLRLLDHPRIAVHWEASDDHGLAEVALVLRSGDRVERRTLSKPRGGARVDRGGIDLLAGDKFLRKSYVPVEVTVEALDNDGAEGAKWGRSLPLVIVTPTVGELEVMRYSALVGGRDRLTDLLAERLVLDVEALGAAYAKRQRAAHERVAAALTSILERSYGELRLPGVLSALVRGQLELLAEPLRGLPRPKQAHPKLVAATERALLSIDSALTALGRHDTQRAALKLSDVAMDAAAAIRLREQGAEEARALLRLDAALSVLEGGGRNLVKLGSLGMDLGEIVENGLRRIRRAWAKHDLRHARLAAEDLAARLRQPVPSLASSGGAHGHGGTEAGGGAAQPGDGAASEADKQAAGIDQALEQLRQEHAAELQGVERALEQALAPQEREALRQELKQLAKEVREAVKDLPKQAAVPGSARSEAARARSLADGMAAALEAGKLGEAARQGRAALQSLDQASRMGRGSPRGSSEERAATASGRARGQLGSLVEQAEKRLAKMQKDASEAAKPALDRAGQREKALAERARQIRRESETSEAPLPRDLLDRLGQAAEQMDGAAKSLGDHQGAQGLDKQRKAQRLLEMALPESDDAEQGSKESGGNKRFAQDAEVPDEHRDKAAARFRKRVTDGLGGSTPPHLRDAVRRYTEGLLR